MCVDVIISPDRQSIHIDLAECRRLPLSSDHEKILQRHSPAFSLIERWLTNHYEPRIISPMAPAVVYQPIVVAVYETLDGRLIAKTLPDRIHPHPSKRRPPDPDKPPLYSITPRKPHPDYWLIDPEIADEWYRLAGIVRPTTGDNRQGAGKANEGKEKTDEPLSEDRQYLLIAMYELKALDSDTRHTAVQIVDRAKGRTADPANTKKALADLVRKGLCKSLTGAKGGYWLKPTGKARAERLITIK